MTGEARRGRPRIEVLPDEVANLIAAGEVVERPASVVRELMDNALDAGARKVRVAIRQGGKSSIEVADDGAGMSRGDALLSLDRHATSKIRRAEDLWGLDTLGFRGEALPSIAAVSRLTLHSSTEDGQGTRVRVDAGRILGVEDAPRRRGTTVAARNLFHRAPVRARFLKSKAAETAAVAKEVHSQVLLRADVAFTFEVDGKVVLRARAGRSLREAVRLIWPSAEGVAFVEIDARDGEWGISGLIQRPDHAKPGFRRVHTSVNGRSCRVSEVVRGADEGYRTTVAKEVNPWLFLALSAPAREVDVNVHPGKLEVRMRSPAVVERFVKKSVRKALGRVQAAATYSGKPGEEAGFRKSPSGTEEDARPLRRGESMVRDGKQVYLFPSPKGEEGEAASAAMPRTDGDGRADRPAMLQIHNTYILAETRDGVIILDQHAAHERVLFESVMKQLRKGGTSGQRLLFPFTIRLNRVEMEVLDEIRDELALVGFGVEPFGADSILVRAVPNPHRYFEPEHCLQEMIQEFVQGAELARSVRSRDERVAMSFACAGAVKAGQALAEEEMHELFSRLFATELPYHDVHGRPTVVRLGLHEMNRKFGRT